MLAPRDMAAPVEDELIPLADENSAAHSVAGHQLMAATAVGAPAIAAKPSPKPRGQSKNGHCPACNHKLPSGAVLCVECGMNLATGQKMQTTAPKVATLAYSNPTPVRQSKTDFENELGGTVAKQLIIPGVLVGVGFIAQLAIQTMLLQKSGIDASILLVGIIVGVELFVRSTLVTITVFLCARWFDVGFVGFWPTILKIAAIALLAPIPSSIMSLAGLTGLRRSGWRSLSVIGLVNFLTATVLFRALFDMDWDDASSCGVALTIVNFIGSIVFAVAIMSLLG